MTRMPRTPVFTFLACLAGLAVNLLMVGPVALHSASKGMNDFRHFYVGGRLAGDPGMYDTSRVREVQEEAFGGPHGELMPPDKGLLPVRLPFYYAPLYPLARLPYRIAWFLWLAVLIAAVAAFIAVCPVGSRASIAMTCCWAFPLVFSLMEGQDSAIMLLILGVGLKILDQRKPFLAGLVLSLCLIKFHLFLLLPLLILAKRAWRLAAGLVLGATILLLTSFPLAGWSWWPRSYIALILNPEVDPARYLMPNLHGLAANFHSGSAVELALSLLAIGLVCVAILREPVELAAVGAMFGSFLLSRHSYVNDCTLLIPALLALGRTHDHSLAKACSFALLVPFQYIVIFFIPIGGAITTTLILLALVGVAVPTVRPREWTRETPL